MFWSIRTCLWGVAGGVGAGLIVCVLVACGDGDKREGFAPKGPAGSPTTGGAGGFGGPDSGVDAGGGCSDEAKLVYVLSLEGELYSFAPAAKKFTKIGPLDCGQGLVPISMAVDRNAVAWVNMREDDPLGGTDQLFKVDTKTAACTPSAITGSLGGMGFSTDDGSTDQETLFMIGQGTGFGSALLKVDFASQKVLQVANLQEPVDLELTGTGDGRLYGFVIDRPLSLAAVDKTTSAFSNKVALPQIELPQGQMFAFSFWGGDFYFYTATDYSNARTTNVTRYRPSDGSVDTSYMTSIGFHIVGAGVSTCAPTTSPK